MPIETTCQTCGKRLRVGDEHAGKLARCPACQAIYTVPQPGLSTVAPIALQQDTPSTATSTAEMDRWRLKTPDGLTFGPVSKAVLDQWQREGRVVAQSQLLQDGNSQWIPAATIYPQLASATAGNPFADYPVSSPNPYAPPQSTGSYRYQEPHRGGLILALSIISIFVCDILGIVAVVMAIIDLSKMSKGIMDPGGRNLTIAGLVIATLKLVLLGFIIALMALANAR
jgi:hypothetical protein